MDLSETIESKKRRHVRIVIDPRTYDQSRRVAKRLGLSLRAYVTQALIERLDGDLAKRAKGGTA